jgi:UDP-N-acetylglucosamine 4,6-dehydratase/5-epimerase
MNLDEAVELVLLAFNSAQPGDIMIQKAPAYTIGVLAQALKEIINANNEIQYIGIRHGEKNYETILTQEESLHTRD